MNRIELKDVSLNRHGKNLLNHLNWTVKSGETWAVLGLNGSGKTTLLKLLMAEYFPSTGQVSVAGFTFGQGDITPLRKKIGVVGSFISERLPKHMVSEKIVLTGKYKSSILYTAYTDTDLDEAKDMLRTLGGGHLLGRSYHTLSQGEKQLILIARSLMEEPEIIILDEATSGLDIFAREKLLHQIDNISRLQNSPTVIYVTHHAEEITRQMTHILLLRQGQIIKQGPKTDILKPEILEEFYQKKVSIFPIENERFFIQPLVD